MKEVYAPRLARLALAAALSAGGLATTAQAKIDVIATIAPVHSLTARVMQGAGEPTLLLPPGTSPHGYAMKPSEAAALQDADVVVWVGEGLENWMNRPLENLAQNAKVVTLDEAEGMTLLPIREGGAWEHGHHDHGDHDEHGHDDHDDHEEHGHDDHDDEKHGHDDHDHEEHADEKHEHEEHGHEEHDHDDHDHEKHADEKHEHEEHAHDDHDDHGHDDHGHDDHAHDAHDHGAFDPHLWLDPRNAAVWVEHIAAALAAADPAQAALYKANAAAAVLELQALEKEAAAIVAPVKTAPFVTFHDAYQYYESRFGTNGVGSIAAPDGASPSAARLREIRDRIKESNAVCVFIEPQFPPKLATSAVEGTQARIATLDPLGAYIETGVGHYPALIRKISTSLKDCLSGE